VRGGRTWRRAILLALAGLIVIQLVPVDRDNPPIASTVPAPADVTAILRRSCFDCHSNETRWPWYSRIAPIAWVVAHDVHEGRRHANFSEWDRLTENRRQHTAREIVDVLSKGEMPLPIYLPAHPDARLSDEDRARLETWARSLATLP
jgi:hypothetical protein